MPGLLTSFLRGLPALALGRPLVVGEPKTARGELLRGLWEPCSLRNPTLRGGLWGIEGRLPGILFTG